MQRDSIIERIAASHPGRRASGTTPRERGDHDLNTIDMRPTGRLRSAAVLVPLVDRPAGMTVLLTERAAHLKEHAGQISFPGGQMEPFDASHGAAALREAEEEVGLPADRVELIGQLDVYVTRTGFEIVPVVGIVSPPFTVRADPMEVAEVFEVPLAFVLDPANHQRGSRLYKGEKRYFYELPYGERHIWGATAGMLVNLSELLNGHGPSNDPVPLNGRGLPTDR